MSVLDHVGFSVLPDRVVRFTLDHADARSVQLVADFTEWDRRPLHLQRRGESQNWEVETAPLLEGKHRYKFVVDGEWMHDPTHPFVEADGHGGWNSVVGVGGPSVGEASDLRILTLNLHTYQETEPLLKLDQIAHVCAALDVDALALQEVGEHVTDPARANAGRILQYQLEGLTGEDWHHQWRFAHPGFTYYHEGLSLLARAPLEEFVEHRLSAGNLSRNVLLATIACKGLRARIASAHVTWPARGGEQEMEKLAEVLTAELQKDVDGLILAGDFNALSDEPHLQSLAKIGMVDSAQVTQTERPTWPMKDLPVDKLQKANLIRGQSKLAALSCRIDYQFSNSESRLQPVATAPLFDGGAVSNVYQPVVSDHLGLLGTYRRRP